jgi:hypothetical protein
MMQHIVDMIGWRTRFNIFLILEGCILSSAYWKGTARSMPAAHKHDVDYEWGKSSLLLAASI